MTSVHLLHSPPVLSILPRPVYLRAESLAAGAYFAAHTHDWPQFLYALSGMLRVVLPTASFVVPPQHALWIPANMRHQVSALGTVDFCSVYIDRAALSDGSGHCRVVAVSSLARELLVAAKALPVEYDVQGRAGRLVATLLDELADLPEMQLNLPTPKDARLRRICDALLENPADPRELEAWAYDIHVSSRTLARLFVQETSLGFRTWRQRLRLYRALELLAQGRNITSIAFEVGYSSSSAFIAAFKAQFGKAPGAFL